MKQKFVNVSQFAKIKKTSRENIYNAELRGEIEIDRSAGFPIVFLNEKNLNWKPRPQGRPQRQNTDFIVSEILKEIEKQK